MHPTEVDEGVTLTGRYRVTELLAEAPGDEGVVAQTWRAIDEVLSRSVVVYVLSADDSRAAHVLEASRRAATISDVRFLRVLDALEEDGLAYVVREWVDGRTLSTLLAESALPPRDAGLVVREVADALARAHGQELYHERLDPDSVIITDGGTVKIVGLATHAALNGAPSRPAAPTADNPGDDLQPSDLDPSALGDDPDPASAPAPGATGPDPIRADTLGLGRLLYAALTARWPTGPRSGLQGGPRAADGTLLSPRQCRAGVPRALDEITERILSDRPRHGSPLRNPREIVDALTGTVGSTPPEGVLSSLRPPATGQSFVASSPPPHRGRQSSDDRTAQFERPVGPPPGGHGGPPPQGYGPPPQQNYQGYPPNGGGTPPPARPMAGYRQPRRPASRWQLVAGLLVALVLLSGVAILGWQLVGQSSGNGSPDDNQAGEQDGGPNKNEQQQRQPKPVEIVDAGDYDPETEGGNGEEHADEVPNAYDGDESTAWTTMSYFDDAEYGGLKDGVGVWFDLGEPTRVSEVDLSLYGPGPTDADILAAPEDATEAPESLSDWSKIGEASDASDSATVKIDENVRTRYVMVFLTKIPPEGGNWRGGITDTVIKS